MLSVAELTCSRLPSFHLSGQASGLPACFFAHLAQGMLLQFCAPAPKSLATPCPQELSPETYAGLFGNLSDHALIARSEAERL